MASEARLALADWAENLTSLLALHWQSIILAIITALVTYILFRQCGFLFLKLRAKKIPVQILDAVEPVIKYMIAFVGVLLFVLEVSPLLGFADFAFMVLPVMLWAATILVSTWIVLQVSKYVFEKLRQNQRLPSDVLHTIEMVIKYSIIVVGVAISMLNVLSGVGYGDAIYNAITSWLLAHSGKLILIAAALVFTKIASKLIATFFGDLKKKTTVQPKITEIAAAGVKYILYAIVGWIIFSTMLSMIGVPELTPLITNVFSVLVGVGLSFAAAGAIGNLISGLILMNWKPYKSGDRVEVGGNTYGDVTDFDVMFTRIVTPTNEVIHVPNSLVLNNKVTNFKPSCKVHPRVSVGYNVDRRVVEALLIKAAEMTKGLTCDPKPDVFVRELGKNYIDYELRACTAEPNRLLEMYSDVQKNILDLFCEANIDLMIPQYSLDATLYEGRRKMP